MTELVADVTSSAAGLSEVWSAMSTADWDRAMRHHRYGTLPLNDTPMMRLSEVEIHHVDLGGRFRPDGWPDSFVAHILSSATGRQTGCQTAWHCRCAPPTAANTGVRVPGVAPVPRAPVPGGLPWPAPPGRLPRGWSAGLVPSPMC